MGLVREQVLAQEPAWARVQGLAWGLVQVLEQVQEWALVRERVLAQARAWVQVSGLVLERVPELALRQ
jgi:hypothetical protein